MVGAFIATPGIAFAARGLYTRCVLTTKAVSMRTSNKPLPGGRSSLPPFSKIQIGEPDANSEYFSALRGKYQPIFLDCFFSVPHFPTDEFRNGEKYIIYGQKGTGKTSALRYMENLAKANSQTEFLIFKKAFLEEIDIHDFAKLPLMLDEEKIKQFKHYHHTVKRLLILLVLSKARSVVQASDEADNIEDEGLKGLVKKVSNSTVGDVIRFGMDSIRSIFASAGFDIEKATSQQLLVNAAKLLKRNNDDLLNFVCRQIGRREMSIRLYLDEIHFAYRSEESLQQDAILVRDTLLAVQSLNERFAEENLNTVIYVAVRSEYLEHPIIATADINHAIESVGFELTWSNFPPNKDHPLFDLIYFRFKKSIGLQFSKDDFFRTYFANIDPDQFVKRTWSKPRDFIRFFKCARKLYPNKSMLSAPESNAVWRNYAQEAWKEMKSAASPFLPPSALSLFEDTLARIAPSIFEGTLKLDVAQFGNEMRPVYELAKGQQSNFYNFEHFLRLLYILGIFSTRRKDAKDQEIFHSYHRGNRNYHAGGQVLIHPTVLKAFG